MTRPGVLLLAVLAACAPGDVVDPLEHEDTEPDCAESILEMSDYTPADMGSEQIVYGDAIVLPLRGPSSQLITIPQHGTAHIGWLPTDRRSCDVEMRVGIVGWTLAPGIVVVPDPDVRWWVEVGHGKYVWTEPPPALVPQNVPSVEQAYLPTRGLLIRVSTRELRFNARFNGGFLAALNRFVDITLSVSFMPVDAMEEPLYPLEDVVTPSVGGKFAKFPPGAKEWRLFDVDGLPYVAAAHTDVNWISIGGGVSGPFDRALWADYMPISPRMWGWGLSGLDASPQPVYAQYR